MAVLVSTPTGLVSLEDADHLTPDERLKVARFLQATLGGEALSRRVSAYALEKALAQVRQDVGSRSWLQAILPGAAYV